MIIIYFVFLNVFFINYAKCDQNGDIKSKKSLVQFRKLVEELTDDTTVNFETEDPQSKLVSFMVQNIEEIFCDINNPRDKFAEINIKPTVLFRPITNSLLTKTLNSSHMSIPATGQNTYDVINYENLSLTPLPFWLYPRRKYAKIKSTPVLKEMTEKVEPLLSRGLMFLGKSQQYQQEQNSIRLYNQANLTLTDDKHLNGRSCVFCNNVEVEGCTEPANKFIPSILCKNEDDLCYSQHTPFGIVDRGCYDVHRNLSTYVCSCNLCNYLSISEMPFIFSKKKDWFENVVELSRNKRLRNSVFKDMSCLSCEVRADTKVDMLNDANCLEGNIGSLPTQVCEENELCGIKATSISGYLWRGCIKNPLYNYWLTLCDSDLCNADKMHALYREGILTLKKMAGANPRVWQPYLPDLIEFHGGGYSPFEGFHLVDMPSWAR